MAQNCSINSPADHAMVDLSTENQGFRLRWAQENEVDLSTILLSIAEINWGNQLVVTHHLHILLQSQLSGHVPGFFKSE